MKVFAYIGSYRNDKSYSKSVVLQLLERVSSKLKIEEVTIVCANDITINECIGCNRCFAEGNCIFNDLEEIKKQMMESDIIIFASPVYAHNVSGNFKTFLDRISYWIHTMRLTGKIAVPIVITLERQPFFRQIHFEQRFTL